MAGKENQGAQCSGLIQGPGAQQRISNETATNTCILCTDGKFKLGATSDTRACVLIPFPLQCKEARKILYFHMIHAPQVSVCLQHASSVCFWQIQPKLCWQPGMDGSGR